MCPTDADTMVVVETVGIIEGAAETVMVEEAVPDLSWQQVVGMHQHQLHHQHKRHELLPQQEQLHYHQPQEQLYNLHHQQGQLYQEQEQIHHQEQTCHQEEQLYHHQEEQQLYKPEQLSLEHCHQEEELHGQQLHQQFWLHQEEEQIYQELHVCDQCNEVFLQAAELEQHWMAEHVDVDLELCGIKEEQLDVDKELLRRVELEGQRESLRITSYYEVCKRDNERERSDKKQAKQEKMRCPLCNNSMQKKNLVDHIVKNCKWGPRSSTASAYYTGGSMSCPLCRTTLAHRAELRMHLSACLRRRQDGLRAESVRHNFWDADSGAELQLEQVAAEGELYWAEPVSQAALLQTAAGGLVLPLEELDPAVEIMDGGLEDVEVV